MLIYSSVFTVYNRGCYSVLFTYLIYYVTQSDFLVRSLDVVFVFLEGFTFRFLSIISYSLSFSLYYLEPLVKYFIGLRLFSLPSLVSSYVYIYKKVRRHSVSRSLTFLRVNGFPYLILYGCRFTKIHFLILDGFSFFKGCG